MRLCFFILFLVMSGCSSAPTFVGKFQHRKSDGDLAINYVQWNSQYAVTIRHHPGVHSSYDCNTGCDLSFVWHPTNDEDAPLWREAGPLESVEIVGYNDLHIAQTISAEDLDEKVDLHDDSQIFYQLARADHQVAALPGAALVANEGSIVGMNIGRVRPKAGALAPSRTAYIPYREIKRQWDMFIAARSQVTMLEPLQIRQAG